MRKKKALINIFFSLMLQLVTVISGFIVPRLFIGSFGSDVNGLINSITGFVGYITILQTGVGSAVKAALYKPLAKKNHRELCIIVKTADCFFKKIAIATIAYIAILMVVFPVFIAKEYGRYYTASLVAIVGISTAAQYFFGITYQMVLEADQCSYIYSAIQILTVIVNTIIIVFMLKLGFSVQIVKLASSIVYVLRPLLIWHYTRRKYSIDLDVTPDSQLLSQRWNAFAQGMAYFIHSKTDVFVLTLLATLKDVSIYSVYALVTSGLSSLIIAIDLAVRATFGNIIANDENDNLNSRFEEYNTLIHILTTVCFSTAAITVFNFIRVYTRNVTDANYIQPIFGILIISAEFIYCLRSPYNSIIYAAGKFKETKASAGFEAGINIVLSCLLVPFWGLKGVAIGTLIAMIYRSFSFIHYLHTDLLRLSYLSQIKRYIVTALSYFIPIFTLQRVQVRTENYLEWVIYATCVLVLVFIYVLLMNYILNKSGTIKAIKMLIKRSK